MIQGVREIFEIIDSEEVVSGAGGQGKLVVIGRGLSLEVLQKSFKETLKLE